MLVTFARRELRLILIWMIVFIACSLSRWHTNLELLSLVRSFAVGGRKGFGMVCRVPFVGGLRLGEPSVQADGQVAS